MVLKGQLAQTGLLIPVCINFKQDYGESVFIHRQQDHHKPVFFIHGQPDYAVHVWFMHRKKD